MLNLDCNATYLNAFNDSWLWHRRLGHVFFDHLSKINSKKLVKGIPYLKFEKDRICHACQLGKQTESSFKSIKDIMTSRPLKLPPQQNRVIEKKNHTLQEISRIMISEYRLPQYLWAEAVNTSCYIANKVYFCKNSN